MKINLVALGSRVPEWVYSACDEYAARFPRHCRLQFIEIPIRKRTKSADLFRIREQESLALLASVPKNCRHIALDRSGTQYSTEQLADQMRRWMSGGSDVALLIGGPDGLSSSCLEKVDEKWALSPLTFPHPLVRVIVTEQLYRAWSIINNLPYHRE